MTFSTPAARTLAAAALALVTSVGLAGCGSTSTDAGTEDTSKDASAQTLDVTIKGDTITPTNKRVEVSMGKPLTITIDSDRSGELHVHSSPEEEIAFDKGTTTKKVTFKTPGVIEVEEHISDTLIAQLEVR
jgi:hypothetical protein